MKNCCVIGLGYIGLPTALLVAKSGFKVLGVDINPKIIELLNSGEIHIVEPGLINLLEEVRSSYLFEASIMPCESDIFIIAVPTPFKNNGSKIPEPDISYVIKAIHSIIPYIRKNNLIILESTSPVGTTKILQEEIIKNTSFLENEINIAYCPERVLPGNIIHELVHNDRVIGGINEKASKVTENFYSHFCKGKFYLTDSKMAELVKLTENSYRDVNIAFANEMSIICDSYDLNVYKLINLCNQHPRVNILNPGCGVGGHCIAVDPWFIIASNLNKANLIRMGREVNINKTKFVINKITKKAKSLEEKLNRKPKIACLGLTFKPDIDDLRESPAMKITRELISKGLLIYPCDPYISKESDIDNYSLEFILKNVDFIVVLVAHSQFKEISLKEKCYLDFCGIFDD